VTASNQQIGGKTYNFAYGYNLAVNSTYDAAGNLMVFGSMNVSYDAENRQIVAGATSYFYDGAGQRVKKTGLSGTTVYVYDAFGQLAAEYASAPAAGSPCGNTCFLSYDLLGSMVLVTDGQALVVARHDYAPFGQEIPAGVGGRTNFWAASDRVNQKFTGQERDGETNLDFFQARYMSTGLGRFMSPDPGNAGADFTNPQSWNAYGYVGGNPLIYVDPSGEKWTDWFGGIWDTISGWFGGCRYDFCGGTTQKGGVDPVGIALGGGLIFGGGAGSGGGYDGGGGSGIPTYTATGTGVADRNPQPVSTPPSLQLAAPAKMGTCPSVPNGPGKSVLFANLQFADQANQIFDSLPNGNLIRIRWFYDNVRTGGPMDYKNQPSFRKHPEWDDFGQFIFGAVGAELGLPLQFIQQAAGAASFSSAIKQKKIPRREFGTPFTGPPWGDQPWAQPVIGAGYSFAFAVRAGGC